jgi:DNA invertase Pin-like site-specific DNA recombinase
MGWRGEQIEAIDEDLGQSATSSEGRPGFQRLLVQVKAGAVGLVRGLELSRLCRSSLDWQALVQLCALLETLLGEQDGLYDPGHPNDRLFLGLNGAMSEFELHLLRLEQAKQAKAARGELSLPAPMGELHQGSGRPSGERPPTSKCVRL